VPAAEPTGPIRDCELPALFAPIARASQVALAVSGGGDSLALLDCVDRWRRGGVDPPALVVLSVDHGLRKSSRTDASDVAAIARDRGIEARLLRWTGRKPQTGIEAAARAARYRLLLGAARAFDASHLLLGHHLDDQAETLLLRLARGSGLFGLSAMRREIPVDGVTIFRPFLEISRSRLAETIAVAGLTPVEDPMNTDPRFARARIRRIMPLIAADGIDPAGLAATARRLADAAEAIDVVAGELIAHAVELDAMAVAAIDPVAFFGAPGEVRMRALLRLLLALGGDHYPPRFERLAALANAMADHQGRARFKRTLAGAVIEWRDSRFVVYREIGRDGLPEIHAKPGFYGVWDGRFRVEIGVGAPTGLRLAALGEAGRRLIGARSGGMAADGALAALPALWRRGRVLAVPGLDFFAGGARFSVEFRSVLPDRLAVPPKFPDFLAPT
jgi:tRNA(Ile)-lysidine synthase